MILAAPAQPGTPALTPTGVAVLLMLALVVDYMSIGPGSIRDRIAFFMALPAISQGFSGGPLEHWTVDKVGAFIDALKGMAEGSYIAGATTEVIIGVAVGVLAIYTVGVLLPVKASKKLGGFAKLNWGNSAAGRLNTKLWVSAALLGVLADLPRGLVGEVLRGGIGFLTSWVGILPGALFGAS